MRDHFLPAPYVEALGWATIAYHQCEFVLSSLVAALESHLMYLSTGPGRSLESVLAFLEEAARPGVLRPEWSAIVGQIVADAGTPLIEFRQAARGVIYSRGGGSLEFAIRALASESTSLPPPANISLARLLKLEEDLRSVSFRGSGLALRVVRANNGASALGNEEPGPPLQ